ncbi:MAG: alpha-amylase family glycosyl hydrolase [Ruminococcus sp.]
MTTFYPYQWDLNYKNPRVFNEMMYNFLFLANKGIDIIRIDAVPYIWKELNTSCRNLPQVHTIVRMMRLIGEIVCPGILLLGEVVMEPEKVVALLRNGRETRMPYALQCNHNGNHLAHRCYQGCPSSEKTAGHCEQSAEGLCIPELPALP